jgi:hypothetical protein
LCLFKKLITLLYINVSTILENAGRTEIGLYLEICFLAIITGGGKVPEHNDKLNIKVSGF